MAASRGGYLWFYVFKGAVLRRLLKLQVGKVGLVVLAQTCSPKTSQDGTVLKLSSGPRPLRTLKQDDFEALVMWTSNAIPNELAEFSTDEIG
ncbi:hypothetical protein HOY80DRAFT_1028104 [Tuber brumale]|nr:hypothetical protein HOY80DRAFT_1028104 [Tuber brumale]